MKTGLPENLKKLLVPILSLVVVVILALFLGQFLLDRISTLNQEREAVKSEEAVLTSKLDVLNSFEVSSQQAGNTVLSALPAENTAIVTLSQIKSKSAELGVIVSTITVGKEAKEGDISYVDIKFDATSDYSTLLSFLNAVMSSLPVGKVENLKFNQAGSVASASVIYRTYWYALPEKIPAVTDPVSELTSDDLALIDQLSNFERPVFEELAPEGPIERGDPFGL